jgi:exonuclease SbcC
MLRSLRIENSYAHADRTWDFEAGLTAITGLNGSGKSEMLDMIRFAFFGAAALRTVISDYKKLKVTLCAAIRGVDYTIERTTTNAVLKRGGSAICTGTKPVNLKIVELFSYGLMVFDTANIARQGQIAAFANMVPSDRKRMIDSTIGLNVIDDLAKWCAGEATARASQATGIRVGASAPTEPVKPENYCSLELITEERRNLDTFAEEARNLRLKLQVRPNVRDMPSCPDPRGQEELRSLWDAYRLQNERVASCLQVAVSLGEAPKYTIEELDAFELQLSNLNAYTDAHNEVNNPVAPPYSADEVQAMETQLHEWDRYCKWFSLKAQGHHTCPSCAHEWPVEAASMEKMGDWEGKEPPPQPKVLSITHITKWKYDWISINAKLERRTAAIMILEAFPERPASPPITSVEIAKNRVAIKRDEARKQAILNLEKHRQVLSGMENTGELLALRRMYDDCVAERDRQQAAYDQWVVQVPAWTERLEALAYVPDRLDALIHLQVEVQTYERMAATYTASLAAFEASMVKAQALEAEADQYGRARAALAEIKARVKTHLVPSLSRVASHLLRQMTGGRMQEVHVSNDFDVRVEGKPMEALSGAELDAAALSLRIGLGQVLTNRVFSVLMADEPDGAMDVERAPLAAECFRNLTKTISQVFLVTHKETEADQHVRL